MSTAEQARRYRARLKEERLARGEIIQPRPHTRETLAAALAQKSVRLPSGCLLWTGSRTKGGYGSIGVGGKVRVVHRIAWELAYGPIAEGKVVCHLCDVRNCIELTHLWLGTYADNNADMYAKGRHPNIGGWNKGRPHSDETRARISEAKRGRSHKPASAEARLKMSAARAAWWKAHPEAKTS